MKSFLVILLISVGFTSQVHARDDDAGSTVCIDRGGSVEAVKTEFGEMGVCRLGHALIEKWTLFHELNGMHGLAVKSFVTGASRVGLTPGNPSSVYCKRVGGRTLIVDAKDGQFNLCYFQDGGLIEEWTLYFGAKNELNEKLVQVLGL